MDKITDLRFAIGAFFTLVGIILLAVSWLNEAGATPSGISSTQINFWTGLLMLLFGGTMLCLALFQKPTVK